jgi:hypothetical protein
VRVVTDAPLTLTWYSDDETTPATDTILDRVSGVVVLVLWRLEVANAFQSALRRKRISADYRDDSLAERAQMPIAVDADTGTYAWTTTLRLAERFGLTIHSLPLAMLDKEPREAAAALNVSLLGLED